MNCQFIQLRVTFACTRQSRAGTVSGTHLTSGGTVRRGSRAAVGEQGALRCHVIRERFFLLEAVQEVVFGTQLVRVLAQVVVQLARSCGFAGYVARVVRLVLKVSESAGSLRRADVRPRLPPALHWLLLPLHGPGAGGGQRRGGGGHARRERRSEGASGGEGREGEGHEAGQALGGTTVTPGEGRRGFASSRRRRGPRQSACSHSRETLCAARRRRWTGMVECPGYLAWDFRSCRFARLVGVKGEEKRSIFLHKKIGSSVS